MKKRTDYENFIVSTKENVTFLHRCSLNQAESILKTGLRTKGDIRGLATIQPQDLEGAIGLYNNGHEYGDKVIIVQIPREVYNHAREKVGKWNDPCQDESISTNDLSLGLEGFGIIKTEFVPGYIDRTTNEVYLKE